MNRKVKDLLTLFVMTTLLSFTVLCADAARAAGKIKFSNLTARQEAKTFSLQVNFRQDSGRYYDPVEFDIINLYKYVRVEPAVDFTLTSHRRGFVLVGKFQPASRYEVFVKKGLRSLKGDVLDKEIESSVNTGDLKPMFNFVDSSIYVPTRFQAQVPWQGVNIDDVEISVRRIYNQNLHQWTTTGHTGNYTGDEVLKKTIKVKGSKNKLTSGVLPLSELKPLGKGVFYISYYNKKHNISGASTLVVTGISMVAKMGQDQILNIWTLDTDTLKPLKGAEVFLYSTSNILIGQCKTGGTDAQCSIGWKLDNKSAPYRVLVKKGKDQTFMRLADIVLANDKFHAGTRNYSGDNGSFEAYLYSQRNLYRPGEVVHLAAVARNSKMVAVPKLSLKWEVMSPRGKVVKEAATTTSEHGLTTLDFHSAGMSDTGSYTVQLRNGDSVIGDYKFLLEEFVPERIKVDLKSAKEFHVNEIKAQFAIQSDYLFGAPVKDGEWTLDCYLKPAFKTIPKNEEFSTGIYAKDTKVINIDTQTGKLSSTGAATSFCEYGTQIGAKPPQIYSVNASVAVKEAGSGRASVQTAITYVGGTKSLLGLKKGKIKDHQVQVLGQVFDIKGQRLSEEGEYHLELFRIRTNWYYAYNDGYYGQWKQEEVVSPGGWQRVAKTKKGKLDINVDIPRSWGQWMVRATDKSTGYVADLFLGYVGYYQWNQQSSKRPGNAADELEVKVSKSSLAPGDKFEVFVTAPFKGRLLIAIESRGNHHAVWKDIDKPGPVTLTLKAPKVKPNFYVSALMLKTPFDGKNFIPARAFGAESIRVLPKNNLMNISMVHPELIKSREKVTIEISNKEQVPTTYTLAAVDEGILQITKYKSPDPLIKFFEPRRMATSTYETLGSTMSFSNELPGGDGPQQTGGDQTVMPVNLVAFWQANLKSDSRGRVKTSIEVPAFQGKLRLMVVGHSQSRMGSASKFLTVRDPIVTQPTLPRFMTIGDEFIVPVAVTNMSGRAEEVKVTVENDSKVKVKDQQQLLQLKNTEQKVARFNFKVNDFVGVSEIKIKAKTSKFDYEEKFTIPVNPKGVEHQLHFGFQVGKNIELASLNSEGFDPRSIRQEFKVTNRPYMNQLSHVQNLIRYPYGCLEQTTSSTLPLLGIREMLPFLDQNKLAKGATDVEDMVQAGIDRVLSMQTNSGGFGYWPGAGEPVFWGTTYATNLLLEAKKLGYAVPESALQSALDYLDSQIKSTSYSLTSSGYRGDMATPYGIYVLAKGGRKVTRKLRDYADEFKRYGKKTNYTSWYGIHGENYVLLAAAAKLSGDRQAMKSLNNQQVYSAKLVGERDYEFTYWSTRRSDGLRLAVLQDLFPNSDFVQLLAKRVADSLAAQKSYYYTTQEMAWGIVGLGKMLKDTKKVSKNQLKKVKLLHNGKEVKGKALDDGSLVYNLPLSSTGTVSITGVKKGDGLWTYADVTGYTENPPAGSGELGISRRYYKTDGTELDLKNIKVGDTFVVGLTVSKRSNANLANLAIVDRLPAGFEVENARLGRSQPLSWFEEQFKYDYMDVRDDRVHVFGKLPWGTHSYNIYYTVRAVTPGKFTAPAPYIEAMYEPENFAYDAHVSVEIR